MNNRILTIALSIGLTAGLHAAAQKTRILSRQEALKLEKEAVSGPYPIYRAYEYQDKGGYYNLLLCEKKAKISGKNTLNNQIAAVSYLQDHGGYREQWLVKDQIDPAEEKTIWFWTKYCSATDLDGDQLIDPLLVYGSKDLDDNIRRVKIIVVYKGQKVALRAMESELDDGRTFIKDKAYSTLPPKIKTYITNLLEKLRTEQGVLLKHH